MRQIGLAALLVAAMGVAGCSKPTDAIIPTDVSKWDTELAPTVKKLSEEDRKLVAGYLVRAKLGEVFGKDGIPLGTTVGQAIESQKAWLVEEERKAAEEKQLKERMQREQQEAKAAIARSVTVSLLGLNRIPRNYDAHRFSEQQGFELGIENKSEKEIAGVSGQIVFIDIFDKKITSVGFDVTENIKPGSTFRWKGVRDYNQFVESHKALWNLDEGKYKTKFEPSAVVFTDGTKLTAPE